MFVFVWGEWKGQQRREEDRAEQRLTSDPNCSFSNCLWSDFDCLFWPTQSISLTPKMLGSDIHNFWPKNGLPLGFLVKGRVWNPCCLNASSLAESGDDIPTYCHINHRTPAIGPQSLLFMFILGGKGFSLVATAWTHPAFRAAFWWCKRLPPLATCFCFSPLCCKSCEITCLGWFIIPKWLF